MTPDSAVSGDLDGPTFERMLNARSYLSGFRFAHLRIAGGSDARIMLAMVHETSTRWPGTPYMRGYADGVLSALGA